MPIAQLHAPDPCSWVPGLSRFELGRNDWLNVYSRVAGTGSRVRAMRPDQYTAGSPLSVGLATTFLNEALIGTLRLMPWGGIGLRNHFS